MHLLVDILEPDIMRQKSNASRQNQYTNFQSMLPCSNADETRRVELRHDAHEAVGIYDMR